MKTQRKRSCRFSVLLSLLAWLLLTTPAQAAGPTCTVAASDAAGNSTRGAHGAFAIVGS